MAEMKSALRKTERSSRIEFSCRAGMAFLLFVLTACDQFEKADPTLAQYNDLKAKLQGQADTLQLMKVAGTVHEGELGYLVGDERSLLPLEQRRIVQQENFWREQIFDILGQHSGHSKEEVANIFAELARQRSAEPKHTE
jgi:uncharacterized protein YdbL (DUF1318 family)